jgi:hypothetical protein
MYDTNADKKASALPRSDSNEAEAQAIVYIKYT